MRLVFVRTRLTRRVSLLLFHLSVPSATFPRLLRSSVLDVGAFNSSAQPSLVSSRVLSAFVLPPLPDPTSSTTTRPSLLSALSLAHPLPSFLFFPLYRFLVRLFSLSYPLILPSTHAQLFSPFSFSALTGKDQPIRLPSHDPQRPPPDGRLLLRQDCLRAVHGKFSAIFVPIRTRSTELTLFVRSHSLTTSSKLSSPNGMRSLWSCTVRITLSLPFLPSPIPLIRLVPLSLPPAHLTPLSPPFSPQWHYAQWCTCPETSL